MENSENTPTETKTLIEVSKIEIKTYKIGAVCACGGELVCTPTEEECKEFYSPSRMNLFPSLRADIPFTHTCQSCENTIILGKEFPHTVEEEVGGITYSHICV